MRFVLEREGVFLNSVGDVDLLPKVLGAAERAGPAPDQAVMAGLAERASLSIIFGLS